MLQRMNNPFERDTDIYKLTCLYMGKSELYDRSLTTERNPRDKTEAYVFHSPVRSLSSRFACKLLREILNNYNISANDITDCIVRHHNYTAQMWVDEYTRLWFDAESGTWRNSI